MRTYRQSHNRPQPPETFKVTVLAGGVGSERDVSLQSGECVAGALAEAHLPVGTADISPDDLSALNDTDTDVFFIALHGEFGEDGRLQQILEERNLAYTGSGPAASALAMDKLASKRAFARAGAAVPPAVEFTADTDPKELEAAIENFAGFVIKPRGQGSSVGIEIVRDRRTALDAARNCVRMFGDCIVEEFIPGKEVTVGVLHGRPLPIIEIRSKNGFYDYNAKYIDDATEFLFDTIEDPQVVEKTQRIAVACFNALDCRDFARIDFILSADGVPRVLEANTIPGFTTHSLLPRAAARAGINMSTLCRDICASALQRFRCGVRTTDARPVNFIKPFCRTEDSV